MRAVPQFWAGHVESRSYPGSVMAGPSTWIVAAPQGWRVSFDWAQLGSLEAVDVMTEKSFHYQIAVADLFSLLMSEDAAGQWMGAVVELEPEAGGVVVVAAQGWPVVSGHVESIRQPDSVTFVWRAPDWPGPLRTVITLEPEADGTRLRLTETGYGTDDDLLRRRDYLWSHWLVRLAATGAQYRPGGVASGKHRPGD